MYHTAAVCWNSMLYYINSVCQLFVGFILGLHRFYAWFTFQLKGVFSAVVLWIHSLMWIYLQWCKGCFCLGGFFINQVSWTFLIPKQLTIMRILSPFKLQNWSGSWTLQWFWVLFFLFCFGFFLLFVIGLAEVLVDFYKIRITLAVVEKI